MLQNAVYGGERPLINVHQVFSLCCGDQSIDSPASVSRGPIECGRKGPYTKRSSCGAHRSAARCSQMPRRATSSSPSATTGQIKTNAVLLPQLCPMQAVLPPANAQMLLRFKRSEMRTECSKNNSPAPLVTLLSWLARTAVSAIALPCNTLACR